VHAYQNFRASQSIFFISEDQTLHLSRVECRRCDWDDRACDWFARPIVLKIAIWRLDKTLAMERDATGAESSRIRIVFLAVAMVRSEKEYRARETIARVFRIADIRRSSSRAITVAHRSESLPRRSTKPSPPSTKRIGARSSPGVRVYALFYNYNQ